MIIPSTHSWSSIPLHSPPELLEICPRLSLSQLLSDRGAVEGIAEVMGRVTGIPEVRDESFELLGILFQCSLWLEMLNELNDLG